MLNSDVRISSRTSSINDRIFRNIEILKKGSTDMFYIPLEIAAIKDENKTITSQAEVPIDLNPVTKQELTTHVEFSASANKKKEECKNQETKKQTSKIKGNPVKKKPIQCKQNINKTTSNELTMEAVKKKQEPAKKLDAQVSVHKMSSYNIKVYEPLKKSTK